MRPYNFMPRMPRTPWIKHAPDAVATCLWVQRNTCMYATRPKGREVYAYGRYPTPAKGALGMLPRNATSLEWVQKYESNIEYHSMWRAHLYFLLLIAYHDQQRIVQIDRTVVQHGTGVSPYLQACHSSLFPGIIDFSGQRVPKTKTSIIDGSFFYHWNNMTVCCPKVVNKVDRFFEGHSTPSIYRKELVSMVSLVSFGTHDPMTGLQHFFRVMAHAFDASPSFVAKQKNPDTQRAARHALDVQRNGLFKTIHPTTFYPKDGFFHCALQREPYESLDSAYKKTQSRLLHGGRNEGKQFLDDICTAMPSLGSGIPY